MVQGVRHKWMMPLHRLVKRSTKERRAFLHVRRQWDEPFRRDQLQPVTRWLIDKNLRRSLDNRRCVVRGRLRHRLEQHLDFVCPRNSDPAVEYVERHDGDTCDSSFHL